MNIPASIGRVLSADKATLHELDTALGCGDLYMLLEIIAIDDHNRALMQAD